MRASAGETGSPDFVITLILPLPGIILKELSGGYPGLVCGYRGSYLDSRSQPSPLRRALDERSNIIVKLLQHAFVDIHHVARGVVVVADVRVQRLWNRPNFSRALIAAATRRAATSASAFGMAGMVTAIGSRFSRSRAGVRTPLSALHRYPGRLPGSKKARPGFSR